MVCAGNLSSFSDCEFVCIFKPSSLLLYHAHSVLTTLSGWLLAAHTRLWSTWVERLTITLGGANLKLKHCQRVAVSPYLRWGWSYPS